MLKDITGRNRDVWKSLQQGSVTAAANSVRGAQEQDKSKKDAKS